MSLLILYSCSSFSSCLLTRGENINPGSNCTALCTTIVLLFFGQQQYLVCFVFFFCHFTAADRCSQEETQGRFDRSQSYHTIMHPVFDVSKYRMPVVALQTGCSSSYSDPIWSPALDWHTSAEPSTHGQVGHSYPSGGRREQALPWHCLRCSKHYTSFQYSTSAQTENQCCATDFKRRKIFMYPTSKLGNQ